MTLTFEPLLPPWAWVFLALLASVTWGWYAWHRPHSCSRTAWGVASLLQGFGLAGVLLVLLNPIWLESVPPPAGKPQLTILLDQSESMAAKDGTAGRTRLAEAVEAVTAWSEELKETFDVRVLRFAQETRPIEISELSTLTPAGDVTDLSQALRAGVSGDHQSGQAVLLFSDGAHNAGAAVDQVLEAARLAKTWDAPIYPSTIGGNTVQPDLELRVPRSQELLFAGQTIPVEVELRQQGSVGDRVTVRLHANGKLIAEKETSLAATGPTRVRFLVTPPGLGLFQYQLEAVPLAGETTATNNFASFQARAVDRPVKALVLEGKPYWDNKFLLRTLMDDPSLEVDCVVRISQDRWLWRKVRLGEPSTTGEPVATVAQPGATGDEPPARTFERREEVAFASSLESLLQNRSQLDQYQVILLGREAESYLTGAAVENLRDWVSRGAGALICYRGAPVAAADQQLARMMPVRWGDNRAIGGNESRFRIQLTERGDDMNWLRFGSGEELQQLPSLSTSTLTSSVKPLAVVLGRADAGRETSPVLTYQPYGTGKVVVVEGAGMWRWAFLAPEFREHDRSYGMLWQSLLRWLATSGGLLPGETFAVQMDRLTFTVGEPVSAVVLRTPESEQQDLAPVELWSREGQLLRSSPALPVGEELGVNQVSWGELAAGGYELRLTAPEGGRPVTKSVQFDVRPDLRERLRIAARPDLMGRIAELSGGTVLGAGGAAELRQRFEAHHRESHPEQTRRIPAWDRWWVFAAVIGIWTTTWVIRRRQGLV